ncbi:helix-turn-helix transcriptional regulator [Tenggerimyces flavus]|uniref:Helix-turn-helix transcriptional regulator n=1 Tax=Tenggerimyces flavus TaxID=1708749 RepID=A0ABV7Y889_9ACTN|nr:helix-turn-helix transcriptional regulator [Tenggerimyces flavus]MBM7788557.1 transcriptional regulator with XRE-family HTH domain [Tenggerimyces flavus]
MSELGRFLRTRRERVRPADVGLPAGPGVRRTPGLRREELATLAGVSIDYYTRLERGKETHPSDAVLGALARVLRLDGPEAEHLRALADAATRGPAPKHHWSSRTVRPSTMLLLESVRPNPAYVVNKINDLLAWNPGGIALFPGIEEWPRERRNLIRYVFLHPHARTLWVNWEDLVTGSVAGMRALAGAEPDAPDLTALVGELVMKSEEFAQLWSQYDVRPRTAGEKKFQHPVVGRMTLAYESLQLTGTDGLRMVAYLADPGTPDHDAMVLLDLASTPSAASPPDRESTP